MENLESLDIEKIMAEEELDTWNGKMTELISLHKAIADA